MGTTYNSRSRAFRGLTLALAFCLFLSILPPVPLRAASASALSAMEQLDQWGVLKGYPGGSMQPDRPVTRAEFVAMMNRAYGFTDMSNPKNFSDVPADAWYADEFAIASTAGYFKGTSGNTASPNNRLSREDAMVLLAKCMRLEQVAGEVTEFTDGRTFGSWSRGYVKAAVKQGIIKGYSDGSFRPKNAITRGEMSQLLVRSVGTLVNGGGEQSLGDVYGTVTLNQPGTVLKDTRIAGNLYITGGLGTGAVTLDNVVVTGKIIIAGGGEAEAGQDSVILRNVEAENLTVDSTNGQYVSLRAEGDTSIKDALLRTNAFVQDRTDAGYGLLNLTLNGRTDDPQFSLSGNLKNIVNLTPDSAVNISAGTAQSFVVDETATGSTLNIGIDATVRDLNLDAATNVTGSGDLGKVTVGANGSTITMLPDVIDVRPGVTANIYGQNMDTKLGLESSADPRILASYPIMRQVAPTSAQAVFSCNKAGTLYWAVSAVNDGTLTEDELITPAAYASKAVKQGNLKVSNANAEIAAAISGLSKGGTYYLSAMLVDNRGTRSPIKITSFGTPDDTVPNFAQGFPALSKITHNAVQLGAMTTKDCLLYHVVLPKGAAAPTAADFKSGAIPGHLGFGYREMTKNIAEYFYLERPQGCLEELTEYDVYIWLTDADGAKSSAVKKLSFKTVDGTPPVFLSDLTILSNTLNALNGVATINEDGTIYWAAVKANTPYPKPQGDATNPPALDSYEAKMAVVNGRGVGTGGKFGKVTAKAEAETRVNMSGLLPETAYDIYYVAQDKAGNYSEVVKVLTNVHTQDNTPPAATQRFSHTADGDDQAPYADSTVEIVFTETVRYGEDEPYPELMRLYQDVLEAATPSEEIAARSALANVLSDTIQLFFGTERVPIATREYDSFGEPSENENWTIDYRNAEIVMDDEDPEGKRMLVRFYGMDDGDKPQGIKFKSGATYHFRIQNLEDTSDAHHDYRSGNLPNFKTLSAQAEIKIMDRPADGIPINEKPGTLTYEDMDIAFTMTPISATTVEDAARWDMLLWFNDTISFDLYYREPGTATFQKANYSSWALLPGANGYQGVSLYRNLLNKKSNPALNQLHDDETYEYVIHVTRLGDMDEIKDENGVIDRSAWVGQFDFDVQVVTASDTNLELQANSLATKQLTKGVTDITIKNSEDFPLTKKFTDTQAPSFAFGFPRVTQITDRTARIDIQLDRPGTVHSIVAPVGETPTKDAKYKNDVNWDTPGVPESVGNILTDPDTIFELDTPSNVAVMEPAKYFDTTDPNSRMIILDDLNVSRNSGYIELKNLTPDTEYFLYIVLQTKDSVAYSPHAMLYKFKTMPEDPFYIELVNSNPVVNVAPNHSCYLSYIVLRWDDETLNRNAQLNDPLNMIGHIADGVDPSLIPEGTTVIQSMNLADPLGSNRSMFDVFADESFKASLYTFVSSQDAGKAKDIVGSDQQVPFDITKNTILPIDCGEMPLSPGLDYAFLCVGQIEKNSTDYVFRAIWPVSIADNEQPKVLTIAPDDFDANDKNFDLTVIFNETLYYYDTTATPNVKYALDMGGLDGRVGTNSRFKSIIDAVEVWPETKMSFKTSPNKIGIPITSFTLNVLKPEGTVNFKPNLSDEYGNNRREPTMNLTFRPYTDQDGNKRIKVVIPKEWDGSSGQIYSKNP